MKLVHQIDRQIELIRQLPEDEQSKAMAKLMGLYGFGPEFIETSCADFKSGQNQIEDSH